MLKYVMLKYIIIIDYYYYVKECYFLLQVSGLVLALAGFICAIVSVPFDHLKFAHGGLGVAIMIIGVTQPLNALV